MYSAPEAAGGYKDGPLPFVSWAGFYAGINGGGAWGDSKDLIFTDEVPGSGDAGKFQSTGGFGGGQIGYNWQGLWHPHLVLGIEADIQGAGISDHFVRSASYFGTTVFDGTVLFSRPRQLPRCQRPLFPGVGNAVLNVEL